MSWWLSLPILALLINAHLLVRLQAIDSEEGVYRACRHFIVFIIFFIISDVFIFFVPLTNETIIKLIHISGLFFAPLPFLSLNFAYRVADKKKDVLYFLAFVFIFVFIAIVIFTNHYYEGYTAASWGRCAIPGEWHTLMSGGMALIIFYACIVTYQAFRSATDKSMKSVLRLLFIGALGTFGPAAFTNVVIPGIFGRYLLFPIASSTTIFISAAILIAIEKYGFLSSHYQQLKQIFSFMFENINNGVIILNNTNAVVQINKTALEIFGKTESLVLNQTMMQLLPHYNPEIEYSNHEMHLVRGDAQRDITLTRIDLEEPRLNFSSMILIQDISEKKHVGEAIQESEEKWTTLVGHVPDLIITVDSSGIIQFVNHTIPGISLDELFGKSIYALVESAFHDTITEMLSKIFAGKNIDRTEVRGVGKDRTTTWYEFHAGPIFKESQIIAATIIATDISQRKQTEQEITALNENLEQLVAERTERLRESEIKLRQTEKMEAIGQLAGGIAHDFNNQLTGILTCAEVIRSNVMVGSDLHNFAETIVKAAKQAGRLTSQLLTFARKGKYQSVPINIHTVIGNVISLLEHSVDKRITIKQDFHANPPIVKGDPEQFQNALLNLAINARDAMLEGGDIIFRTQVVVLTDKQCKRDGLHIRPGNAIEISVIDTGIGMDEDVQKHLFEPFFTTKEPGKGTGMGLAAVYGTVENHHGAIVVTSEPGKGSTFTLYLPIADFDDLVVRSARETTIIKLSTQAKILVVDDEDIVRETLVKVLKKLGYEIESCSNGLDALKKYTSAWESIDLVLLDMIMPKMGGKDTFLAMKKINPTIKALLISGYSMTEETKHLFEEGVLGFIQKPYSIGELSQRISEALNIKK